MEFSATVNIAARISLSSLHVSSLQAQSLTPQSGKTKTLLGQIAGGVAGAPLPAQVQALLDRLGATNGIQDEDQQRFQTLDDDNNKLAADLTALAKLQSSANAAISSVTLAATSLTNFISNTTGIAVELVAAIARESTDATFTSGLTAGWPNFDDVAALQNKETGLKNALNAFKSLYDPFVPKQTAALALLKQDCQSMVDTLKKQAKVDQDSANALNDEIGDILTEQTALTDYASLLQAAKSTFLAKGHLKMPSCLAARQGIEASESNLRSGLWRVSLRWTQARFSGLIVRLSATLASFRA